jgi:hypothetical protein
VSTFSRAKKAAARFRISFSISSTLSLPLVAASYTILFLRLERERLRHNGCALDELLLIHFDIEEPPCRAVYSGLYNHPL